MKGNATYARNTNGCLLSLSVRLDSDLETLSLYYVSGMFSVSARPALSILSAEFFRERAAKGAYGSLQ